jgi:hypothetical protein
LYNNRSLFSDYYLRELVRDDPHWRDVLAGVAALRQRIAEVYKRGMPGIEQASEAEVERRLIRPVLDALAHVYEAQPGVRSAEGTKTPDYGIFATVEDCKKAAEAGIDNYWKHALAVGDAKAWDRPLDRRIKAPGDPFTNHNPSYQIDFYLRATDLKWGILTNGRLWRLYYRDLSYRLDVYYEVNLPELLELGDEVFNYFAAFFAQKAFLPDEQGECFLDRAYKGSLAYATKLTEELKDNVYEALRLLTEGFLRFPGNGLAPQDLDRIREHAFVVIYRLLFILYAEDRGFLPLENRDYAGTYSLRALAKEIAQKVDGQAGLRPAASGYWSRLQDLFRMIDAGDAVLGIPPYNGGLFEESRHPELGQWKIGDSCLAGALDMLTRANTAERTGRGFVSYREMSIRELGSIYEGLLEHRPRVARAEVYVVRDGKAEKIVPADEVGNRRVIGHYPAGSVYLETDTGERKATGSYYTPDYIVKYIVANTLGPVIEAKKSQGGNLIEGIQSLKVLDPAMGSGHFLVEATDFLARALVESLGGDPRELGEEEIRWARREVVERCIYGVDLNPLAVELAKLSLWLTTATYGKPLNFLDHHLRCGNSLIGARVEELGSLPDVERKSRKMVLGKARAGTQMSIFSQKLQAMLPTMMSDVLQLLARRSEDVGDIKAKESVLEAIEAMREPFRLVADLWVSAFLANVVTQHEYHDALHIIDRPKDLAALPAVQRAKVLRDEKRFFHWELEFPEVFFRDGSRLATPGFDVVVGNPPWVEIKQLPHDLTETIFRRFVSANNRINLYGVFLEVASGLTNSQGIFGLIVPNSLLSNSSYAALRGLIASNGVIRRLVRLPEGVFESVKAEPVIIVVSKSEECPEKAIAVLYKRESKIDPSRIESGGRVLAFAGSQLGAGSWLSSLEATTTTRFLGALAARTVPLGETADFCLGLTPYDKYAGHSRELIDSKAFHSARKTKETHRPLLCGSDISRYCIDWCGREYIDYGPWLAAPRNPRFFRSPRVIVKQIIDWTSRRIHAGFTDDELYHTQIAFSVIPKEPYSPLFILAVVNSSLMTKIHRADFVDPGSQRFLKILIEHAKKLPVPAIEFTTPPMERQGIAQTLLVEARNAVASGMGSAPTMLPHRLFEKSLDPSARLLGERSDIGHDLLALLAQEMVGGNKERIGEIKGFLAWLEGYVGISLDDLKNKTKVGEYYRLEGGWDELAAALDQNRRAIQQAKGIDITRREPREAIRQEYEASMARLRPLLRKIELTDRLIDLIVYRLYGLTDEEVAIVEGRA